MIDYLVASGVDKRDLNTVDHADIRICVLNSGDLELTEDLLKINARCAETVWELMTPAEQEDWYDSVRYPAEIS